MNRVLLVDDDEFSGSEALVVSEVEVARSDDGGGEVTVEMVLPLLFGVATSDGLVLTVVSVVPMVDEGVAVVPVSD